MTQRQATGPMTGERVEAMQREIDQTLGEGWILTTMDASRDSTALDFTAKGAIRAEVRPGLGIDHPATAHGRWSEEGMTCCVKFEFGDIPVE